MTSSTANRSLPHWMPRPVAPERRRNGRGSVAKLHDCGRHGHLTADQIAKKAGVSTATVYGRRARGIRGEALCERPVWRGRTSGTYRNACHLDERGGALQIACRIARMFGTRTPSVAALRNQFGMSRATAYRWVAAWRYANCEPT
jgi:transposase